jgi:NADPH2:quinone reductase
VFVRGALKAGETLLVHGGASGIGTTAIQLAKAFGARVATTAGSAEKCEACRRLGADLAIDYKTQDFGQEIQNAWGKDSVNLVLDMVGGSYVARNIALLAPEGRHVSIAVQESAKAEIDITKIMQKRVTLTGSTLRPRPASEKASLAKGLREKVWPLLEAGKVAPIIFRTFGLEEAEAAHAALEKGDHIGKVVLSVV